MADYDPPQLEDFVSNDEVDALIQAARREDIGPDEVDITSQIFIGADQAAQAAMQSRQAGRLAGACLVKRIAQLYSQMYDQGHDQAIDVHLVGDDGQRLEPGQTVANIVGPLRSVLAMERVALNFVSHLSGIATLTAAYVDKTAGTKANIYDTRKTLPGWRGLAKYAVACGGGKTHRHGLYDAMLIKDNHLAHLDITDLHSVLVKAAKQARREYPALKFIEVEVDAIEQLRQVIATGVDMVLLDNMSLEQLRQAVALRDELEPQLQLEASGNVNLDTVGAIAATGVDRISVGPLTHSAPALDLGLDIQ